MALISTDDDVWLREASSCERLFNEIYAQIADRNREAVTSIKYQKLSSLIKVRLNQFNEEVKELKRKLEVTRDNLTDEEVERRLRQVEFLESNCIRFHYEFLDLGKLNTDREQLFATDAWQEDDSLLSTSDREALLKRQTVEQMQERRKKVIEEQNEGLDNLSKIISRQKNIAVRIHEEVLTQNELLDDIGTGMESVDGRIGEEIIHIRQVARKPSLCGYYLLIIFLLIVLFVVLWIKL